MSSSRTPLPITYHERASFYDIEYVTTVDHAFLSSFITGSVRTVLEIPCGAGRNIPWLSRSDCVVVGADVEPAMVERYALCAMRAGVSNRIDAVIADIRTICLGKLFDLILVPQGGIQLLNDEQDIVNALNALRRHLTPDGHLLIDIALFHPTMPGDPLVRPSYYNPMIPDGQLVSEWERSLPGGGTISRSRIQTHRERELVIDFYYSLRSTSNSPTRHLHFQMHTLRLDYHVFLDLADQAGLEVQQVYRNYDHDPFDPSDSSRTGRMIFLCRSGSYRTNQRK